MAIVARSMNSTRVDRLGNVQSCHFDGYPPRGSKFPVQALLLACQPRESQCTRLDYVARGHLPSQHPIVQLKSERSLQQPGTPLKIQHVYSAMDPFQVYRPAHSRLSSLFIPISRQWKNTMNTSGQTE
ncbi:hypothetical protein THAOC_22514 [Thalassiosira oceanica]|uniref:Uncharacterized protein n=1 Tax=Thalassiosira oceanica TaxID=159749 RepID=K0RU99_THAOC|nr:hypothetical protein THAOC_22514 [Thalassiosira oceanica]|eukprot:EJK57438.1 hypothetical protein THAOC_22514 [Thalassiosira oceanica]